MERSGATHFANDARPSGVLKYPGKTTPEILDQTEKRWKSVYGGRNKGGVVAMDQGLDYTAIAATMVDSQWNEGRQSQVAEICRWFRVQPHKVMDLTRSTNNNIEHQSIEFVQDTILPWVKRLEQEADIKLFGTQRQGRLFTKLNIASLLRGDSQAQAFITQIMMDRGVWSPNDVLKMNDQNSIGPEGDKRFVQANMIPLEMAGEQYEQQKEASASPAGDSPEEANGSTNMHTNRLNGHGVN
jgi:HK97 family phage portal protein